VCCEIVEAPHFQWWVSTEPNRRKVESFQVQLIQARGLHLQTIAEEKPGSCKTVQSDTDAFSIEYEGELKVHSWHNTNDNPLGQIETSPLLSHHGDHLHPGYLMNQKLWQLAQAVSDASATLRNSCKLLSQLLRLWLFCEFLGQSQRL
jgi:hypothetical protein